jgi:quercetin dioxygenase-like cupin family protein
MKANFDEGELDTTTRFYHPDDSEGLQLFEVAVPPGFAARAHSHDADEIIFVLEGELHLGQRALKAGDSVFIPGATLYSFRAGPDGLRFLNFRATVDATYYSKDEHMARRGESRLPS